MEQLILSICLLLAGLQTKAGDGDKFFNANMGFLLRPTLNDSLGYEHELNNGNAVELFGEVSNYRQQNTEAARFNACYLDGGLLYKYRLAKYKNSALRLRLGPLCRVNRRNFFLVMEAGMKYNLIFPLVYNWHSYKRIT